MHHIVIQGIDSKAIFEDDKDQEAFLERLSRLLQEMDADAIGRYRFIRWSSPLRTVILASKSNEVARRLNVDRSTISRATRRLRRDPELPAATKTIQRELETNQH